MIRLPGVLSIASKIAQEEGESLRLVRKRASLTIFLRLPGVEHHKQELHRSKRGAYDGKGSLCNNFTETKTLC